MTDKERIEELDRKIQILKGILALIFHKVKKLGVLNQEEANTFSRLIDGL